MKIDLEILTNNLKEMAGGCVKSELELRPYYLGIPFIAKLQIEFGAIGMCVNTMDEVEELIQCGITDFVISKPLEDYTKAIEYSLRYRIMLVINLKTNLEYLAAICKQYNQCIEVLVDYDYSKEYSKYREFIELINTYDEFDFAGIQAYNTKNTQLANYFERYDACYDEEEEIKELLQALEGIQVDIVSGLSTATAILREDKYFDTSFTECQVGEYALMRKYQDYNLPYECCVSELDDPKIYLVADGEVIDEL